MYELKKNGKVFTSKFVGTEPSSYEKRIYRAAVSQRLRNTALDDQNYFPTKFLKQTANNNSLSIIKPNNYPEF